MSLSSPAWFQREKSPCGGTLAALLPASSSDSDSGCALEDYSGPTTEICGGEASPHLGSHSPDAVPDAVQTQLRIKVLLQQLPPQDCDERYCPSIGEEERKQLQKFAVRRQRESLGQGVMCPVPSTPNGYICKTCGKRMSGSEQGVFSPKLGHQSCWHPACFVCQTCHQPLVDLIYFHHDGKIYCGRHHAEFFRPRCASCDQLIFTSECMEAEGMRWHEEHFCCLECDLPLGARRYVMKGGQPCCCACFENLYADVCQACGETIGVDSEQATFQGQHWHAKASCFCCSFCQKALLGQLVTAHNGLLFCSEACSLEKESALSSTGSDSSDSAFISAPSPDSTPTSRMRNSSPACSSAVARTNVDSCKQTVETDAMERLHATVCSLGHSEFSRQEEVDDPFLKAVISSQHDELQLVADSLQAEGISVTHPLEVDQSPSSARENQILRASLLQTSQQNVGDHQFRSCLSSASNSSVLIMDVPGGLQGHESAAEQDDTWCPTCSSSSESDSEPEGFFFGKPIPKPGARRIALPYMEQQQQQTLVKGTGRTARVRVNSKQCSVC